MLKKKFYFIILSILCLGISSSFGQLPKTNIVIDDMLAGGGGCIQSCSKNNPGSTLTSSKVIYKGGLSYFLASQKKVLPVSYSSQDRRISYHVEVMSNCLNEDNPNSSNCSYSFWVDFFTSNCSQESVAMSITNTQSCVKTKTTDGFTVSSSSTCNTFWDIDVNLSFDGVILESPNPNCNPIIEVTKEEWVCSLDNSLVEHGRMISSPNPTTGLVDIRFKGVREGNANIQIYNNVGSIVEEISSIPTYEGQNSTQIDLSYLPVGLYNIAIRQGETILTQRIQKL